jgi:hypothetical protein
VAGQPAAPVKAIYFEAAASWRSRSMMLVACDKILRGNIHGEKFFAALIDSNPHDR